MVCLLAEIHCGIRLMYVADDRVDAFSGAKLAECGYDKEKSKKRRLELFRPDERVDFEFTGKMYVSSAMKLCLYLK